MKQNHYMKYLYRLAAAGVVLISGCSKADSVTAASPSSSDPEVELWTIATESIQVQRQWLGSLEPLRILTLQAPIAGRIDRILVTEGEHVDAGEALLEMGGSAADARRQVLREREKQLQEELERWQRLESAGAAGPAELSEAKMRYLEVRESLAELDALVDSAALRAPVSGHVRALAVSPGSVVNEGEVLIQFEDGERLGLRLSLPLRELDYLQDTQYLSVVDRRDHAYAVTRVLDGDAGPSGFVTAEILVEVEEGWRRSEVELRYQRSVETLIVPWTAVASDGGEHWVALVDRDSHAIERRSVRLGRAHTSGVEVLEGLSEGDWIVRYEPRSHTEGSHIQPAGVE